eukprot:187963_1
MEHDVDDEEEKPIIIDNGSYSIKAGFGGHDFPNTVFQTIVGRPNVTQCMVLKNQKTCYVGDECNERRGILDITYPINHGIVCSWDNMEKVWHHTFYNHVRVAPEEHPILITNPLQNPRSEREKCTQIMFETFNVPKMYISEPNLLSLYAHGQVTGCVLSVGHGVCTTSCIFEGYAVHKTCRRRIDFGGKDITLYLTQLLNKNNKTQKYDEQIINYNNDDKKANNIYSFSPLWTTNSFTREAYYAHIEPSHFEIINDIKNKLAFVDDRKFDDNNKELMINDIEYELPDGHYLNIGRERYECMEILFNPKI